MAALGDPQSCDWQRQAVIARGCNTDNAVRLQDDFARFVDFERSPDHVESLARLGVGVCEGASRKEGVLSNRHRKCTATLRVGQSVRLVSRKPHVPIFGIDLRLGFRHWFALRINDADSNLDQAELFRPCEDDWSDQKHKENRQGSDAVDQPFLSL